MPGAKGCIALAKISALLFLSSERFMNLRSFPYFERFCGPFSRIPTGFCQMVRAICHLQLVIGYSVCAPHPVAVFMRTRVTLSLSRRSRFSGPGECGRAGRRHWRPADDFFSDAVPRPHRGHMSIDTPQSEHPELHRGDICYLLLAIASSLCLCSARPP